MAAVRFLTCHTCHAPFHACHAPCHTYHAPCHNTCHAPLACDRIKGQPTGIGTARPFSTSCSRRASLCHPALRGTPTMGRSPPVPNPSTASLPLCAVSQKASQGMGTVRWIEKALCPFTALGCLAREHTRPETGLLPVDWGPVNPPAASTVRDVPAKDVRTPMPVQGAPAPHPPPCPTHHADSHTPQKVRPLLPFLKPLGAPSVFWVLGL